MSILTRRLDSDQERGAVALIVAVLSVLLMVLAAFAVDAANAYAQNRQLSVAADAAALAAAAKVGEQLPAGTACTASFAASQVPLATQVANDYNTANNRANGSGDSEPVDSVTVTCDHHRERHVAQRHRGRGVQQPRGADRDRPGHRHRQPPAQRHRHGSLEQDGSCRGPSPVGGVR
jgi:hypothetical protein